MRKKAVDPASATLLEIVYGATGSLKRTAQITAFVQAWGLTRDRLGRPPSIEEYADDWKVSYATAYREQLRLREAFPDLDSPAELLDAPAA